MLPYLSQPYPPLPPLTVHTLTRGSRRFFLSYALNGILKPNGMTTTRIKGDKHEQTEDRDDVLKIEV